MQRPEASSQALPHNLEFSFSDRLHAYLTPLVLEADAYKDTWLV